MRIGVYAGSFDPPTNGHLDIIRRATVLVDRLVVGIGVSASKKPLFSFDARRAMLDEALADMPPDSNIEVQSFEGLLIEYARELGAGIIIRGLRSAQDFDYEAQMTAMNREICDSVETVFLQAAPTSSHISSTLVRQIAAMGGDVSRFVPPNIADRLVKRQ